MGFSRQSTVAARDRTASLRLLAVLTEVEVEYARMIQETGTDSDLPELGQAEACPLTLAF